MGDTPIIDPRIKTIGPTGLRNFSAAKLKALSEMVIITDAHDNPLAVMFPYQQYMDLQSELLKGREAIEQLSMFPNGGIVYDKNVFEDPPPVTDGDIIIPEPAPSPTPAVKGLPYVIENTGGYPYQGPPLEERQSNSIANPDMQHSTDGFTERREVPRSGSTVDMEIGSPPPTLNPLCDHCKQPSPNSPCAQCFSQAHRFLPDRCMKCWENAEAERRAVDDGTGTDRDDIDRMAFDREVS